jgi:opacity protein-like surface antigen
MHRFLTDIGHRRTALASCGKSSRAIGAGLLLGLGVSSSAVAQTAATASNVPYSAFYIGLGASYNSVDFGNQKIFGFATSDVYKNGALISSGSAGGPGDVQTNRQNNLAPSAQLGYFQHFPDTDWLWGGKLSYSHLGTTSIVQNVLLPQAGSTTDTGSSTSVPFTGNAVIRSYQTNITHQMALTPFIGRSFANSFVYIGAGPTLSQTKTTLDGVIGFADVTGVPSDISGLPQNFSRSSWVFGGAAMVGAAYFFDPSWFVDCRYMYSMTGKTANNFPASFTNPNGVNGTTIVGGGYTTTSGSVISQGIMLTLNKAF